MTTRSKGATTSPCPLSLPPSVPPPSPCPNPSAHLSQGVLESSLPTSPCILAFLPRTQCTGEPEESSGMCITYRTRDCFQANGEPDWGSEMMLHPNKAHSPAITSRSPLGAVPRDTRRLQAKACLSHQPGRQRTPPLPQVPSVPPQPSAQLSRIQRNLQHQEGYLTAINLLSIPPKYEHKQVKKNT